MSRKILPILLVVSFIACRRSSESPSPCIDLSKCADVNCRPSVNLFKFVLLDEETGEDLVFAPSPLLRPEDIKVRNNAGEELTITPYNQGFGSAHLSLETGNNQVKDTLFLEIQGQRVYTMYPRFCYVGCCTPMAYEMRTQKGGVKPRSEYIFPLTY